MNRPFLPSLVFFLTVLCASGPFAFCMGTSMMQSENVGSAAPDFTLATLTDEKLSLTLSEMHTNGPVLLIFWATWCPACVEEIPLLNEWHEKYAAKGLQIMGVNVAEPRSRIVGFQKDHLMKYPVVLDEEGDVANRFGIVGLPAAVLLAKGGKIIYYGFVLPENVEALISDPAEGQKEEPKGALPYEP